MIKLRFSVLFLCAGLFLGTAVTFRPQALESTSNIDTFTKINWTQIGNFPFNASEAQSIVVNGKWYSFGGYTNTTNFRPTKAVRVFNPQTGNWSPLADLTKGLTHAGIATDGENIYIASGYIEGPNPNQSPHQIFGTKEVWRYNIASNTYSAMPGLPQDRAAGSLVLLGRHLHYMAGTNKPRTEDVADHWALNLDNLAAGWQTRAAVPEPRHHAAAVAADGYIFYIGGQNNHDGNLIARSAVHRYDPTTNSWQKMADLPQPRNHMGNSTVVYGRRIFVLGGQQSHHYAKREVYAYNLDTNTWANLTDAALPEHRHSSIAAIIDGVFYLSQGISADRQTRRMTWRGVPEFAGATATPTSTPTNTPTATPTSTPTATPSSTPTNTPTNTPTDMPTNIPTSTATPVTPTSTPDPDAPVELVSNGSFQAAASPRQPMAWNALNLAQGDRVRCNDTNPAGYDDPCAFTFKGQPRQVPAVLAQRFDVRGLNVGDTLTLSAYFRANNLNGNNQVFLTILHEGASTPVHLRMRARAGTYGYELHTLEYLITQPIQNMRVRVRSNAGQGRFFVDQVSVLHTSAATGAVLALPSAPTD